jgi:hypothetical protein
MDKIVSLFILFFLPTLISTEMIQLTPANFCLPHFTLKIPTSFQPSGRETIEKQKSFSIFKRDFSTLNVLSIYSFAAKRRDRTYSRGKKIDFVQTIREIEELHPMTTT